MGIAHDAGVRGAPGQVFVHKVIDNKITELAADIQYIMRKAITNGQCTGIVNTIQATATCFF